jgi:hypothetical protein
MTWRRNKHGPVIDEVRKLMNQGIVKQTDLVEGPRAEG